MYQQLESQLEQCKTWPTKGVFVDVCFVNESGREEKEHVDICLHIGADSNDAKEKNAHQSDFMSRRKRGKLQKIYLSDMFNEFHEKGREEVTTFITNHFDTCGGGIMVGATRSTAIVFQCFRHRVHVSKKEKNSEKKPRNTSTSKPKSKDDNCLWRFTLYFEPMGAGRAGRYFFYRNGSGNHYHNGHAPKQEHEIMKRRSQLDENELEIKFLETQGSRENAKTLNANGKTSQKTESTRWEKEKYVWRVARRTASESLHSVHWLYQHHF